VVQRHPPNAEILDLKAELVNYPILEAIGHPYSSGAKGVLEAVLNAIWKFLIAVWKFLIAV